MITSFKIAKVFHLAAFKIGAAKSAIGVGALVAATATGIVVTEQAEPNEMDVAVVLINQVIDAETGLSTAIMDRKSVEVLDSLDPPGTITTGVQNIMLKKIAVSGAEAEEVSVAQ